MCDRQKVRQGPHVAVSTIDMIIQLKKLKKQTYLRK